MLPLLLLAHFLAIFADYADKLKALRRTRPLPDTWPEHIPNLLLAEWHIRSLTASGVEVLLAGGELDLLNLVMVPEPPPDVHAPAPLSALDVHRRFEAVARFHADPERYIRRQAARIAAARAAPLHSLEIQVSSAAPAEDEPLRFTSLSAPRWALGIPAPP
jgi:hypothetical protein